MTTAARPLPIPKAMARAGRSGWLSALGFGAALGAVTLVIPSLLSTSAAFALLAVLLGMIASVYVGYALNDGRLFAFALEYVGLIAFGALAVVALVEGSALVLAAGYAGHAAWDLIHHRHDVDTLMPSWYVPFCVGYDVVVAAYVLVTF